MCKDCYKKERCLEREQFGRCSEYRSIDAIRNEVQAVMQSCRSSEPAATKDEGTQGTGRDGGNQKATERVFLASEVQETDKNEKGEIDDGWSIYFSRRTVLSVRRGRLVVHGQGTAEARGPAEEAGPGESSVRGGLEPNHGDDTTEKKGGKCK